ncbi:MAG: hypothetical protein C0475_06840 [Planctomyces sp.]|nr:hypothetical protein [Planctomyces sp.]MBA4039894.1 hypothetical protein [Planctomyces sp.]MBA4119878.1 hypothetical protein [Isosphaera sp.]
MPRPPAAAQARAQTSAAGSRPAQPGAERAPPGSGTRAYGDPAWYDALHTPGTAGELRLAQRLALRARARAGVQHDDPAAWVWLEPLCGSGRCLRVLARWGRRALGCDGDPRMLAYAAQRLGEAAPVRLGLCEMGACDAPFGHACADVAYCPHNSVRHARSDAHLARHLASVGRALRPSGVYVVGVGLQRASELILTEDVYTARRGRTAVHQVITFEPLTGAPGDGAERVTTVTTAWKLDGRGRRSGPVLGPWIGAYRLRCFSVGRWEAIVARAGLRQAAVFDQSGRPADPASCAYAWRVLTRGPGSGRVSP